MDCPSQHKKAFFILNTRIFMLQWPSKGLVQSPFYSIISILWLKYFPLNAEYTEKCEASISNPIIMKNRKKERFLCYGSCSIIIITITIIMIVKNCVIFFSNKKLTQVHYFIIHVGSVWEIHKRQLKTAKNIIKI